MMTRQLCKGQALFPTYLRVIIMENANTKIKRQDSVFHTSKVIQTSFLTPVVSVSLEGSVSKWLSKKYPKNYFKSYLAMSLLAISTASISAMSAAATPVTFESQDWQVVCDNTRTCRLAGYQAENDSEMPVSVLLVRRAGSNTKVDGKVKLGGAKEGSAKSLLQLGNRHRISLIIDGKDYGEAQPYSSTTNDASLTETQVNALLNTLAKDSKIEFVLRNTRWQLSGKGATAVMLKADEAQGRLGTLSALVNKGTKPDSQALSAESAPQLRLIMPKASAVSTSNKTFKIDSSSLTAMMKNTLADAKGECPSLSDDSSDGLGWRVSRLNGSQLLAQHKCWVGAYNVGHGMWVMNDNAPYSPKLVTVSATSYDDGKISSVQKGRGIGDCLAKSDWIWTGSSFKKSYESTTGLCRMIEAGGAWDLPTYVSDVKRQFY